MRRQQRTLDELDAVVLVVSFEPPRQAARLAGTMGLPYRVLSDPERRGYAAFELGRAERGRLWSMETARAYATGLRRGHLPRRPHGDVAQLGGDFVIDRAGMVIYAYRGSSPADRPPVATLIEAMRGAAK